MISQAALKLGRRCRRLSGFARSAGRKVAAACSEPFLPLRTSPPAPQRAEGGGRGGKDPFSARPEFCHGLLDLYDYQVCLGDVVELWYVELVELDTDLARAVERGRQLREARGLLSSVLEAGLSALRDTLAGALEPGGVRHLLRSLDRVPRDAAELQPLAERLFDRLIDPALEMPPVRPGVEIDPLAMVRGFETPMRELGATVAELAEVEATVRHLRAKKAEQLERLKLFAGHVERYFVALYDLAGCPELAQRLRNLV